jgi:alcohol dehydrogenase
MLTSMNEPPTRSHWTFHNPVEIHFGRGSRSRVGEDLDGSKCLIVTSKNGRHRLLSDELLSRWASAGEHVWVDTIASNPSLDRLEALIAELCSSSFDAVVAYGGGSVIDSAKALTVSLSRGGVASLRHLIDAPAPRERAMSSLLYAIPTTAGTGSEVTPFATIWDYGNRKKLSLSGTMVFPRMAIVDPDTQDGLPASVTSTAGLDAINQALESVWNRNATTISLGIAVDAFRAGADALPRLVDDPFDMAARERMAQASLLAGMAISQTRTALCHSMSYPLTMHFGVPHGLACAFTMAAVAERNFSHDDGRFTWVARMLGEEDVRGLVRRIEQLTVQMAVYTTVAGYIPHFEALKALAPEMYTRDRADNNWEQVTPDVVHDVLRRSWERTGK